MPRCSETCTVPLVPLNEGNNMVRVCPYCSTPIHVCCAKQLRNADYTSRSICTTCWDRYGFGPEHEDNNNNTNTDGTDTQQGRAAAHPPPPMMYHHQHYGGNSQQQQQQPPAPVMDYFTTATSGSSCGEQQQQQQEEEVATTVPAAAAAAMAIHHDTEEEEDDEEIAAATAGGGGGGKRKRGNSSRGGGGGGDYKGGRPSNKKKKQQLPTTSNKKRATTTNNNTVMSLEDLVKPYSSKSELLVSPPPSKKSKWWHAFHLYQPHLTQYAFTVCCNVCGKELNIGKSLSTTTMKKHLQSCCKQAYDMINRMNDQDGSNTRSRIAVFAAACSKNKPSRRGNQQQHSIVVNEQTGERITLDDITKPYGPKQHLLMKPPSSRRSNFWYAFHCFNPAIPENNITADDSTSSNKSNNMACCNTCGEELILGRSLGTSNMQKHLVSCNPAAFKLINTLDNSSSNAAAAAAATTGSMGLVVSGLNILTLKDLAKPYEAKRHLLLLDNNKDDQLPHQSNTNNKWLHAAYHLFDTTKPEAIGKQNKACCNTCGDEVSMGSGSGQQKQQRKGPSSLSSHISDCNPLAHSILSSIEDCSVPGGGVFMNGGVTVLTLKDVSKPFGPMKHVLVKPPTSKASRWWHAFSLFDKTKPGAEGKEYTVCCNMCGGEVKIGKSLSTSSLPKHLSTCNPLAYKILESIDDVPKGSRKMRSADGGMVLSGTLSSPASNRTISRRPAARSRYTPMEVQDLCSSAVARYLVANHLPFSAAGNAEFRAMLDTYGMLGSEGSSLADISVDVTKGRVKAMSQNIRKAIFDNLKGGELVAAADCWSSNIGNDGDEKIQSLLVSWIHNFALRSAVLETKACTGEVTANAIARSFDDTLKDWGIEKDVHVPFLISGVDGKLDTIIRQTSAEHELTDNILCLDYLLQKIASIAYKPEFFGDENDEEAGNEEVIEPEVIHKARMFVKLIQTSSKLSQELIDTQLTMEEYNTEGKGPMTLVENTMKKWWSVYGMLDRLLYLRAALQCMFQNGSIPADAWLSSDEWNALEQIRFVFKPFMQAPRMLEDRKYVCASLTPFIVNAVKQDLAAGIKSEAGDLPDETLREKALACSKALLSKLDGCFYDLTNIFSTSSQDSGSSILHRAVWYAHALDPRFKKLPNLQSKAQRDILWNGLLQVLVASVKNQKAAAEGKSLIEEATGEEVKEADNVMEDRSDTKSTADGDGIDKPPSEPPTSRDANKEETHGNSTDKFFEALEQTEDEAAECLQDGSDESIQQACENELQAYKFEPQMRFFRQEAADNRGGFTIKVENHPLGDWWEVHHRKYPFLWKLAKRYLAIPAMSVPVKRAFKSDEYRGTLEQVRLAANDVENQSVFLSENMHWL